MSTAVVHEHAAADGEVYQPPNGPIELSVEGMHCASCVGRVEGALRSVAGVADARVNLTSGSAVVSGNGISVHALLQAVEDRGFTATPVAGRRSVREQRSELEEKQARNVRSWKRRALAGLALWLPIAVLHMPMDLRLIEYPHSVHGAIMWMSAVLASIAQVYVGWAFYTSAWKSAAKLTTNMDTLIALGSTVAWVFSAIIFAADLMGVRTGQPVYWEAAAGLLALISLGHWLEARTMASASSALRELLALQPDQVTRVRTADDDQGVEIPSAEVIPGDLLVIRPGDRVGVDGRIVAGASALDESVVTGEPIPVEKGVGAEVTAGSLNTTGRIVVQATTSGRDTTIARIAEMVRSAQATKAEIARLADRVCAIFVPAVISIALLTFAGWLAYGLLVGDGNNWGTWAHALVTATTVLVISCPCALGLATPTAVMVGSGAASGRGILVKSAAALERAAHVNTVLLDKTGTLTVGQPVVTALRPIEGDELVVLALAAGLAGASRHPLSRAIVVEAQSRRVDAVVVQEVQEKAGLGLTGRAGGAPVALISLAAAVEEGVCGLETSAGMEGTVSVVVRDGQCVGLIGFEDALRPEAAPMVARLQSEGIRVVLLTGDRSSAARKVARHVGIAEEDVRAEVTPAQKREVVRSLAAQGLRVAMVGDGINDAAALAEAGAVKGVGIAIGTGTNIAVESADVVIPAHRLVAIPETIELSRATLRTIKQNLFMSFMYNVAAIPAAALGFLGSYGPMIAAAAMALSDVSVVGNAVRLKRNLSRRGNAL